MLVMGIFFNPVLNQLLVKRRLTSGMIPLLHPPEENCSGKYILTLLWKDGMPSEWVTYDSFLSKLLYYDWGR